MVLESSDKITFLWKALPNISAFQDTVDGFARLTGMPSTILERDVEILVASGWQKICTQFRRKNSITASRCLESDTTLAGQLAKGDKTNV